LLRVVERVVEQSRPPEFAQLGDRRPTLVGDSHRMRTVRRSIGQAARAVRTPVLIHGESGTGKELVARAIHDAGPGGKEPFIGINCAALTESLLESELFGYDKGAFTGAAPEGKQGLFAAARRGTLFLDEVGEMAPSLQAKLLRVLQERTFRPVGATVDQAVSCRVVTSTNRDLRQAVENGDFRQDLFYRLNVLTIEVPPLRERREDLQPLARFFLHRCLAELGKNLIGLSSSAERALQDHEWPGNVRELRNVIEHAVLVCPTGEIGVGHLGLGKTSIQPSATRHLPIKSMKIREMERELITVVLDDTHGNISKAARTLGINRSTLYAKIKEYGLSSSRA
jgi:transcriptional regulator with PAS, ATPase and Fis domain